MDPHPSYAPECSDTPLTVKELPQEMQPREEFVRRGAANVADEVLLAILLRTGVPGKNVTELARELLRRLSQTYPELQLLVVTAKNAALKAELEALQVDSARALSDLKAQREADRMHLQHDIEQLRGRMVRRLDDSVEMLEVGLKALQNKTPRTEVMLERAEHVVEALRAELGNLREE